MEIGSTLTQRQNTHGEFKENAQVTEDIMDILRAQPHWPELPSFIKVGVYFIVHKLSRAICGNPYFKDHWHDIQGYAKIVEDRVNE